MYYSQEDVDLLETKLTVPGGESYVRRTAMALGPMLIKSPQMYKTFGVYWWAIKAALKRYFPEDAWFKKTHFDQLMYDRAWHGSLFRTVLAGAFYHGQHAIITSDHEYTGRDGEDHSYTLFDEDAGF